MDDVRIPAHLGGTPQELTWSTDLPETHPHFKHRGECKGITQILRERGLWDYFTITQRRKMVLECADCKTSGAQRAARVRAQRLHAQDEAKGLFVDPEALYQAYLRQEGIAAEYAAEAGRTECCWKRILDLQTDFQEEKPELQRLLESRGHRCVFLPAFHCELNPIELYWGYIKNSESSMPL